MQSTLNPSPYLLVHPLPIAPHPLPTADPGLHPSVFFSLYFPTQLTPPKLHRWPPGSHHPPPPPLALHLIPRVLTSTLTPLGAPLALLSGIAALPPSYGHCSPYRHFHFLSDTVPPPSPLFYCSSHSHSRNPYSNPALGPITTLTTSITMPHCSEGCGYDRNQGMHEAHYHTSVTLIITSLSVITAAVLVDIPRSLVTAGP